MVPQISRRLKACLTARRGIEFVEPRHARVKQAFSLLDIAVCFMGRCPMLC